MTRKQVVFLIFFTLGVSTTQASIITNGGFESGLTGWTVTTSSGNYGAGTQGFAAYEGSSYFWGFDNAGPGVLEQVLSTDIGTTYSIDFAFSTNYTPPPNTLSISVGDLVTDVTLTAYTWQTYSGTFTASSTTTALDFFFLTEGGTGTVWVDDVNVTSTSVPEPSSLALMGLCLAGLGFHRRKSSR